MVALRELSETPGNCFSCKRLTEFIPCGVFKCSWLGEGERARIYCDTNHPPEIKCEHWVQKTGCTILTVGCPGQFAGIRNY